MTEVAYGTGGHVISHTTAQFYARRGIKTRFGRYEDIEQRNSSIEVA